MACLEGRGSALGALMLEMSARFRKSEPATGAKAYATLTKPGIGFSNNKPTDSLDRLCSGPRAETMGIAERPTKLLKSKCVGIFSLLPARRRGSNLLKSDRPLTPRTPRCRMQK